MSQHDLAMRKMNHPTTTPIKICGGFPVLVQYRVISVADKEIEIMGLLTETGKPANFLRPSPEDQTKIHQHAWDYANESL